MSRFPELDFSKVKTYKVSERTSKVHTAFEGLPPYKGMSVKAFLAGLPKILGAGDLMAVAKAIVEAKNNHRPIIAMFGGHVIKCGCSPVLIDLASRGFITHFASNGSAAIHDAELAAWGQTSEDVAEQLEDGSFGMASDTAELLNSAARRASESQEGFGEALGAMILERKSPFAHRSLSARSCEIAIPYTIHVALGTDIVHQHPCADGPSIGDASMRDFRILAQSVAGLGEKRVVLNLGSAVIMPEVFLKTLSVARNTGHSVKNFVTVNMDIIQHYRPRVNVVTRPVSAGGKGYAITGHHEIMIPLLAAAIYEEEA